MSTKEAARVLRSRGRCFWRRSNEGDDFKVGQIKTTAKVARRAEELRAKKSAEPAPAKQECIWDFWNEYTAAYFSNSAEWAARKTRFVGKRAWGSFVNHQGSLECFWKQRAGAFVCSGAGEILKILLVRWLLGCCQAEQHTERGSLSFWDETHCCESTPSVYS